MAVSDHLLVLLPVLFLCGATEYYVRPTESANTCPGEPCLTFSQYSNNSDHYFKSNTIFKFLPGTHHIDRPVHIRNVQNMSLESFHDQSDQYPHVVAQFYSFLEVCNCNYNISCSAIYFDEVADVVIKGINLTVYTPNISGIAFLDVSNISIQSTSVYSHSSSTCGFGIHISQSETVEVSSVSVHQFGIGFFLTNANNISITLTTTSYNYNYGIFLFNIHNINITNTTTTHNRISGIALNDVSYSFLNTITTMYNKRFGIFLQYVRNVHMINTIAAHCGWTGMFLQDGNSTHIINTTAMYNNHTGIIMQDLYNTVLLNIELYYNGWSGMYFLTSNNSHIMNTSASYNGRSGVYLSMLHNTLMSNTVSLSNSWHGLSIRNMNNTKIIYVVSEKNVMSGMILKLTINTTITTTVVINNFLDGVDLVNMRNTWLTNITAINNTKSGIVMFGLENTHIINATASGNTYGIELNATKNTNLRSIHVTCNTIEGISLFRVDNSNITALTASHNQGNGIGIIFSQSISITAASIQDNVGLILLSKSFSRKFGYFFQLNVQMSVWSSTEILIQNSSFVDINAPSSVSTTGVITTGPSTLPAIIALFQSTLEIRDCSFNQNHLSAVRAHKSNVTLSGNVVFSNNTAVSGTAFILVEGSIISLARDSNVKFEHNFATNTGGVFYIGGNDNLYFGNTLSYRKCFLNIPSDRSTIQFIFVNNSAGIGGDILYGGQVALSLDGDWNCLESFENVSTVISYRNDLSWISSSPSRVCFCDEDRLPDCMIFSALVNYSIYPGQNIFISAVTVGQDFGTVAGSVYGQYIRRLSADNIPELDHVQKIQSAQQYGCNLLKYSIYSPNVSDLILVLTAQESMVSIADIQGYFNKYTETMFQQYYHTSRTEPMLYSNVVVYTTISILPCPVGFMLTTEPPFKCACNQLLQEIHGVHCNIQHQTFGRSGLVWVGTTQNNNGTNGTLAASQYCPINYCNRQDINVTLVKPDSQCINNHSGILCGACQPGLSLALGSERCLPCSSKYLTLLIPFTLAGPVLVGLITLLDLTVSQGTINGLIFYANVIQAGQYIFLPGRSTNILFIFIAWFNLDLGIETCFFEGSDAYHKTWLQFVFPLYIWSISGLIIILSKYNRRVAKVMGNNSVPVLATLFLFSYAKLFRIIISALSYTVLYTSEGHKTVWSADGNVNYLGPKHIFLFVIAVATLFLLFLPYTLILFLGQWLHMCHGGLIAKFLFNIKPFVDSHYAPLKEKHCYWFGFLLLLRAAILLITSFIPADHSRSSIVTISILASSVALTFVGTIVYQNAQVSLFNRVLFLNLILISGSSLYTQIIGSDSAAYAYTLIGLAFLQCVGLVSFNILSILRKSPKVMAYFDVCLKQHFEDDRELLEQAGFLRNREFISEREGSECSGIMESLTT